MTRADDSTRMSTSGAGIIQIAIAPAQSSPAGPDRNDKTSACRRSSTSWNAALSRSLRRWCRVAGAMAARPDCCSHLIAVRTVRPDVDRLPEFLPAPLLSVERVQWRGDLHCGPEAGEVADPDGANAQHDAIEVEEDPRAEFNVRPIVAERAQSTSRRRTRRGTSGSPESSVQLARS